MATVIIAPAAQKEFEQLPLPIQARVLAIFARLENWPNVSGWKALRGNLARSYRIRTGDYRVVFSVTGDVVTVWKIGYRGSVYD
ncbi:MAG TPA: type II toxin-antitoxin system RelE/ParE family toxin [Tepidisphaeraceae bacterium]|nr:type II toxin-antitoxin system RelE/ParE family toxin [Tepidisphaeraceae bacterium]